MAKGKITKQEIVDDRVFEIGKDYAKGLEPAIKANEEWLRTFEPIKAAALEYAGIEKQFKVSKGRKEFLQIKKEEERVRKQAADALKAEQNALATAERVKQTYINTEKKQLDLEAKKERATRRNTKMTIEERVQAQALNKIKRDQAKETLGLIGPYQKLSKRLDEARLKAKDTGVQFGMKSKEFRRAQKEVLALDTRLKHLDKALGQSQRYVGEYERGWRGVRGIITNLTSALGLMGGLFAAVQVFRNIFQTFSDFDRQLIAVGKTTNMSKSELAAFKVEVVALGKELDGISIDGLLDSAEVAGQLGIKGSANILKFSETIEKLKLSSDIVGQESVQDFAKFIEVSQDSVENADRLGSVITELGNNFATTEKQVLSNATEIQKGIAVYNTSAQSVLGLGAATSALGSEADTSRTAIQKTFAIFNDAITTGKGLQQVLELTGMTQAELSEQFEKDASVVFQRFIKGLSETQKQGKNLAGVLNEVGISEVRQFTVVGALASNYGVLENALGRANSEYETNTALNTEAAAAAESISSIVEDLKDRWEAYTLEINNANDGTKTITGVLKFVRDNLDEIIDTIVLAVKVWIGYRIAVIAARTQTYLLNKAMVLSRASAISSAQGATMATSAWKKFNTALKANALGIALGAITAIVYGLNKLDSRLEDNVAGLRESNEEFLDQAETIGSSNQEIGKMIHRYEELNGKTSLNKDEQNELNDIIKEIAKNVPSAVTEINKYGEAMDINAEKARNFTQSSGELVKREAQIRLKETKNVLKELTDEMKNFEAVENGVQKVFIRGLGNISKVNGEYVKYEMIQDKRLGAIPVETKLTEEQIVTYLKKQEAMRGNIDAAKEDIKKIEDTIAAVTGEKNARQLAAEQREKEKEQREADIAAKAAEIRNVENLKSKIKELRDEQEKLTLSDRQRSQEINNQVENLQKEIDAILGVKDANKDAEKAARERAKAEFELNKFLLEQRIIVNQNIVTDDDEDFKNRFSALKEQSRLEIELAKLVAKSKFDVTKEFSEKEIEALLTKSGVSKRTLKKVTDEELLIIEEYQAKRREILGQREDGEDTLETERIQREAEQQKLLKEKQLNDEIRLENEAFLAREGLYEDEANAIENHERRVAEIKKKYALDALNTQVQAIEKLLESEEISAEKRLKYETELAEIKRQISDLTVEHFIENDGKEVESTREKATEILTISGQLSEALSSLTNSIHENRIQRIDDEIAKNNEKHDRLLERENLTEDERRDIENARRLREEQLEARKRKEQRKQAILNKAMAATEAGISTALAVVRALAHPPGPPTTIPISIMTGALGAIQLAAILAKPIPAYAMGTEFHPGGKALVGEVQPEVVQEPGKDPYIVDKPSILDLPRGTKVLPDADEYDRLLKASVLTSIDIERKKLDSFQASKAFNQNNKELIDKLDSVERTIKRSKTNVTVYQTKPTDFEHELFRLKNTNWRA